ncbi:hypothetical protein HNR73_001408 [Phytomonospora endophytica]|uniref:Uncharacterized protein n=1 Tax=Phytomonospora endophytica TaxID=714109 RepID=A0A841FI96_9ACTN|nr:hypothetical protein [Phytomonospora endophytica]GIG64925.1 hypothetical protein Pen01_12200 [Phytomonospora endophytica]
MARVTARRIWHAPDPEWYVARICFKTGPPRFGRTPSPPATTSSPAASDAAPGRACDPVRVRRRYRFPSRSTGGDSLRFGEIPRTDHRGTPRRFTAPTVSRRRTAPGGWGSRVRPRAFPPITHPGGVP